MLPVLSRAFKVDNQTLVFPHEVKKAGDSDNIVLAFTKLNGDIPVWIEGVLRLAKAFVLRVRLCRNTQWAHFVHCVFSAVFQLPFMALKQLL